MGKIKGQSEDVYNEEEFVIIPAEEEIININNNNNHALTENDFVLLSCSESSLKESTEESAREPAPKQTQENVLPPVVIVTSPLPVVVETPQVQNQHPFLSNSHRSCSHETVKVSQGIPYVQAQDSNPYVQALMGSDYSKPNFNGISYASSATDSQAYVSLGSESSPYAVSHSAPSYVQTSTDNDYYKQETSTYSYAENY